MSDEINNGGPAFPAGSIRKTRQRPGDAGSDFVVSEIVKPCYEGITARDYFAAKAMQGMVSTVKFLKEAEGLNPDPLAVAAYQIADAMLKARESK